MYSLASSAPDHALFTGGMLKAVKDSQVARLGDDELPDVTDALIASNSRAALLDVFHRYIELLFPDPYSSLWIADEERIPTWLLLIDQFGNRTRSLPEAHRRIAKGDGAAGRALASQQTLFLNMQKPDHRSLIAFPDVIQNEHIRELIAIPISSHSPHPPGVLVIGNRHVSRVDSRAISNLSSIGRQTLTLMSRLYQQELTKTITGSIWELFQSSDDRYYSQRFLKKITKVIQADWASVVIRRAAGSNISVLTSLPRPASAQKVPLGPFIRAATTRPIRLFDISAHANDRELQLYGLHPHDLAQASNWLNPALAPGDHLLSVPFTAFDELQSYAGAVIFGRASEGYGFLKQDEDLLETNAAFITVLTGYRQKLQTQDTMLTVAKDVAAAREIHSVVESTLLGAVKVTGATAGFVALRNDDDERLQLVDVYNLPNEMHFDVLEMTDSSLRQTDSPERVTILKPPSPFLRNYSAFSDPATIEVATAICRDRQPVGMLVLSVPETEWSNEDATLQALRLFADQIGIAHSERLLADRAERFQRRIDQIASEATASLVTITLAHEVKNAINVLGVGIERLGPIAHSLRAQDVELRERRRLADRLEDVRGTSAAEIIRVSELANIVRDLTTGGSLRDFVQTHEKVYLNDVVRLWAKLLQDMARDYKIKLNARYDSALDQPKSGVGHPCMANPARLGQIIINLLTNAFQASHPGTRVDLSTNLRADGDNASRMAVLRVADYGRGMDATELRRCFDMFFSTKPKGYGLGLPVVKAIVDSFDGTIDVKSDPGKGTIFSIGIPCQ